MWCGRELRRSAPPRIFYHSYALLSIYLVLSTTNNCLQSTNSPVYPDGHASSTGKFLVAEPDGLHRVRVHDTLKRKGFISTRTNKGQLLEIFSVRGSECAKSTYNDNNNNLFTNSDHLSCLFRK